MGENQKESGKVKQMSGMFVSSESDRNNFKELFTDDEQALIIYSMLEYAFYINKNSKKIKNDLRDDLKSSFEDVHYSQFNLIGKILHLLTNGNIRKRVMQDLGKKGFEFKMYEETITSQNSNLN